MALASGVLQVDVSAVVSNWRLLNDRTGAGVDCGAVVKADAYGLGVKKIAPALLVAGCQEFFVSSVIEGIELRKLLGANAQIFVLHGCQMGDEAECVEFGLYPVLISKAMADRWFAWCRKQNQVYIASLKLNTGMNRWGLSLSEVRDLYQEHSQYFGLMIKLLMSHLACADNSLSVDNAKQLEKFRDCIAVLSSQGLNLRASLANSAGIFLGKDWCFDLVRPGVSLYGGYPCAKVSPLKPVVQLNLRILMIRQLKAGDSVGYGGVYRASREETILLLAGGYADGLLRSLLSGSICIQGKTVPIIGRVSMDSLAVNVTELVNAGIRFSEGDDIELLGKSFGIDALAAAAGTISYEVLTGLGSRFKRVYVGDQQ